jgi:hypothetical protein
MHVQISLSGKRLVRTAVDSRPLADNDDDPFDPPPARALRAPALADVTMMVADAVSANGIPRAA